MDHRVRLDLWALGEASPNASKSLFSDPGLPGFPLMQSAGSLTEPEPFPSQVHSRIGQGRASCLQNDECPYAKPDPVPDSLFEARCNGIDKSPGWEFLHEGAAMVSALTVVQICTILSA